MPKSRDIGAGLLMLAQEVQRPDAVGDEASEAVQGGKPAPKNAMAFRLARFGGPFPVRARQASSPSAVSRTRWLRFSTAQWPRFRACRSARETV